MSAQSCFPDANRGWQAHGGIGVTGISSGVSRDTPTTARHKLRVAMMIELARRTRQFDGRCNRTPIPVPLLNGTLEIIECIYLVMQEGNY
ncbi:hypothetical protein [Chromobacterium vaccinii]|uniref:hypothetical protein n=1 Tax=Chromobacterium vaccinii TaxID=1108595 RepID=UPI001E4E7EA0|nr:hypothetical protein [Chromobacterium vaccinii]MCD4501989.1 hypothetical protein [Chromobacterium vaccinii]